MTLFKKYDIIYYIIDKGVIRMKTLDITFHFTYDENIDCSEKNIYDLVEFMIDQTWDEFHDMNLKLENYEVSSHD